ncbi:hypothetical protein D3C76_1832180 [compost metagenome]
MSDDYEREAKCRKDEFIAQASTALKAGEGKPNQIRTIQFDPALNERRIFNTH